MKLAIVAMWFLTTLALAAPSAILAYDCEHARGPGGEDVKDLSGNHAHGTFERDVTRRSMKFGNALELTGLDYVYAGDEEGEFLSLERSDCTLLAWVVFSTDVAGRPGQAIMGCDEGSGTHNKWLFRYWDEGTGAGRSLNFHINDVTLGQVQINSDPWEANTQEWYQLGVVRQDYSHTFFINGEPHGVVEDPEEFEIPEIFHTTTIGWAEDNWGLVGVIDEVIISQEVWTQRDITAHFKGGVARALNVPDRSLATTWAQLKR